MRGPPRRARLLAPALPCAARHSKGLHPPAQQLAAAALARWGAARRRISPLRYPVACLLRIPRPRPPLPQGGPCRCARAPKQRRPSPPHDPGCRVAGQQGLGKRLTPLPKPREGSSLVTSGIYAYCRHPM